MANQLPDKREQTRAEPTGRPLQRISWNDKVKNGMDWFKQNIDYYLKLSRFHFGSGPNERKDVRMLYQVYNNKFPLEWFRHITDPLNATNPAHKNYPAKIRPTGMLRTNIDLLLQEFNNRPFSFTVANMGGDGYNAYLDGLEKAIEGNLQEHFLAVAQQAMAEAGHSFQQVPQDNQIELPDSVKERFHASYKDNLAIHGQKWVKRAIREYDVKRKLLEQFKDWLIAGDAYSYKNIEQGNFIYERVPVIELDYDKSPNIPLVEDGEWAVRRQLWTLSDVVDHFYDELKDADYVELETRSNWVTPFAMYDYLQGIYSFDTHMGKCPVYHVVWKGRKPIRYVTYTDPLTGQTQETVLDENTPMDPTMKLMKTEWVSEVYEGWRLAEDIYVRMRGIPVQRNEMNNHSRCKLLYNGRRYSDTHTENVSVMEMGLPNAIMYMITDFVLEKTLAKNKGKIALIDQNSIPKQDGWDEEKFFYYADALGYMLVNRNQMGVDKSWNQYHVLDMSLWDQIEKLIQLRDSFSNSWDKMLGVNPQRKAEIGPSDGLGTTQMAIDRSAVITGMIFTLFEQYIQSELQGFLDYSKFMNVDGIRGIYNSDDFDRDLLQLDPNSYCSAELGLFINFSVQELQKLNQYKAQMQAMIQNGAKQSTVLEVAMADNVAELMAKLKVIEDMEAEQIQQNEQTQHEQEMELEQLKEQYEKLRSMLKIDEINAEWDRRDENAMYVGEYAAAAAGDALPDASEISRKVIAAQKLASDERKAAAEIASRERINKENTQTQKDQIALEDRKLKSKEKMEAAKLKVKKLDIRSRPKTTTRK